MLATQALNERPTATGRRSRADGLLAIENPYEEPSFPLGVVRRGDPVRAYVNIIEGCNDFCAFCVVPYTRGHERMRPKAEILADVQEAAASGRREVQLLGQIVNHYQAPDDPGVRLPGAARSGPRRARPRTDPICEPASAAHQRPAHRRRPRPAEGVQAPAPSRAVRVVAGAFA